MLRILLLIALLATGCGREDSGDVVVVESPDPDFSAAPGQVIITAKTRPSPKPSATPKVVASVPVGDGTVPFLPVTAPLATVSGEFQPLVRIELHTGAGKQVEDQVSTDGAGVQSKFRKVKPGPYLMKVFSDQAVQLLERKVNVNGEGSETIAVGAVTFGIPKEREDDVMKAIQVTITAEPAKQVVLKGTLQDLRTKGVVGELHKRTALLPYGRYTYTLADVSADATVGFRGLPKGTPPQLTENGFECNEAHPVTLVNLEGLIRTK